MAIKTETIFLALGTVNSISVSGDDASAARAVRRAVEHVQTLHGRLSAFDDGSDISSVNSAAGRGFVAVHPETLSLVGAARSYAALTGGAFDPTIRPLVNAWNIGGNPEAIPDPRILRRARRLVDYRDIALDPKNGRVMLRRCGMALDLGGIAKGYAADSVRNILLEGGVTDAVVNLGGTTVVLGGPKIIGIQHPGRKTGTPMGRLALTNQSAVTSGSYEKFSVIGGRRYHHLLDPRTGRPAEAGLKSVTLIGSSALELDALTTAVFILGPEEGSRLAEKAGLEAVWVTNDDRVLVTAGLRDSFRLFEESEASYGKLSK